MLDLDETLIHYNESASTLSLRPGAESFIRLMSNLYEVVIWTAATEDYAQWAFSYFVKEAQDSVMKILDRRHTTIKGENMIKDLSHLGRDLSKVVIIDNLSENF